VTFLLTDLEGSTRLWEQDPDAMKAAMVRHDELLEKTIAGHQGFVFSRMGDGMAAAFGTARDAVNAATTIQSALTNESWITARPLRTRIGLHTDEGVVFDNGYASLPINRCSRLMSSAHGGQVVVSSTTEALVREQLPDGMSLIDLGEHRLRDLGHPTRVFQLSLGPEEFPPLRSLDAFPGNLPAQASSFIGRKVEQARIASALEQSRLVTITGVGGVGKTRLAIQLAAELLPKYRDGAWLVELAPLRDSGSVAETVAATFHLAIRGASSPEDSLIEMLAQKQMLMVVDNCEHIVGAVSRLVARIERECPGVAVLATSREGLAIDGEQLIALPPLKTGEPGDDIGQLVSTDAVNLFVERARRVKAEFMLTDESSRAVVEICQRLDGVPLAIELAAARVLALSPAELVRRLDRRFQVLAGGRRGAVERHATLRAAIDWSYELLSPAEQRVLARLAVFSAGCTLDAIEDVCTAAPVNRDDAVDLVSGLVARSLVVAEDHGSGMRYRLLETIRQYGEERLAEWGETDSLHDRHGRFYGALSAEAAKHFFGPEQAVWTRRLNNERADIRAALTNAIDTGNATLSVQMVADHPHQRNVQSPAGEIFPVPASRVLDLPGAEAEPGYPRAMVVAAYNATPDWDAAESLCRRALEADRRRPGLLQGPRIDIDVCHLRAMRSLAIGDYPAASAAFINAAQIANADGYPGLAAMCFSDGVNTALLGGAEPRDVIGQAQEAVALARLSGMPGAVGLCLNSVALALATEDPDRSRAFLKESVELTGKPGEEVASGLLTACVVAGRLRDWDLTLALTARMLLLTRWFNNPAVTGPCLALCARALASEKPEIGGVLQGAGYTTFRQGSGASDATRRPDTRNGPNPNFLITALHETGDLVAGAFGAQRAHELRRTGAAMSMDEAVSYALANVDPRLLTGPITVG
jgi:predicted ATPase/class 3 adenylate cyclase